MTLFIRTFAALMGAAPLFIVTVAQAGIADCGNISVEADAQCKVEVAAECNARCTPPSLVAACSAEAYVSCTGMCNVDASAECTVSCDIDACEASCQVNPGEFDCSAQCELNAKAMCEGKCSAEANMAQCQGSCEATATGECKASCKVAPPTADCRAKCEASCQGQCKARANVDCQANCQTSGYASCEARLTGGKCEVECSKPEGALFCNGRYIDHGGNMQKCIDALKAQLQINVDVSARGSAACAGNTCKAEGEAAASCAAAPWSTKASMGGVGFLVLVGMAGLARFRRDRRV